MKYEVGDIYTGSWDEDLQHGEGTIHYHDGYKYIGNWKLGYKSGKGTLVYPNGCRYVGMWENNKQTEGTKSCYG